MLCILKLSVFSLTALATFASAAPANTPVLEMRGDVTVLASGNGVGGNLPDWGLIYRASGYLAKGGCPSFAGISTCYVQRLAKNPKWNIDTVLSAGYPVQSNFISTNAIKAVGPVQKYTFKMYLDPSLKTPGATGALQLVQIVSKEPVSDGPQTKVYFDVKNNTAGIYAFNDIKPVISVPLSKFTGKTILHSWTVKGGPGGYADIVLKDAKTGAVVLKYLSDRQNTVDSYRIRLGPIRRVNGPNSDYIAYFGDWSVKNI